MRDRTLDSPDLITGLCVVTKRLDTGSPWILANNTRAPYWNSTAPEPLANRKGHTGNSQYRLANLVRASTAAPHFFDPEILAISEDERKQPLADVNAKLAGLPWLSLLGQQAAPADAEGLPSAAGATGSPTPTGCSSTAASRRSTIPPWRC